MKQPRIAHVTFLSLVFAALVPVLAQTSRHPITHEDVWLMKRLGAPVLSPDGRWAVLSVTEPAYEEKDQSSDLWIVPTDGSAAPRRLTSTNAAENGTAWSPDGKRLAFSARRDGDETPQVYVLSISEPGEAQRITRLSTGARSPVWRPDGKVLLFTSDVYPGAATDEANRKAAQDRRSRKWNARVYDGFPIRDWDRWLDERQPSLFVQTLEPGAVAKDILAGSSLAAAPGFGGQTGSGSENISARWTPDGERIVFVATANRNEAAFADVVQSLWVVPATGGEPQRFTTDKDSYSDPAFSRDGKTLFARMEPATDRVYNATRLVRWSWPGGSRNTVTGAFDRSVGSIAAAPDNQTIYFLAEDAGRQRLYQVTAQGGNVREVGSLSAGTYGALSVAGSGSTPAVIVNWESAVSPPEVARIDVVTGKPEPLSRFNRERAASIDWEPLQEFWFTSAKGRRIHNFLALPPAFDASKKYPLFVVIHGGPHGQWIDQFVIRWNYHMLAAPGYAVLLTNYTGSTGFGEKFAQAIQGDPLETPGNEILQAVDEALQKYPFIDSSRIAAGGASYGGHLANWLAVTTTRFKALVSHAGLYDLVAQWGTSDTIYSRELNMGGPVWENEAPWKAQNPILRSGQLKTPVLVTVGERDFRVPMNNAIQYWSALQRMRVPSRLIVFPEENHWVLRGENSRFFYGEIHNWLAKWLGPSS
jgi:dipeptidyl aminopeptidase/acylaminoacyl peptidase